MVKNADQCFLKPKMSSSNVSFCLLSWRKKRNQNILTFKKLESDLLVKKIYQNYQYILRLM